jgi:ubiquinone/menaquinone biosynthesis C-methylase UbiE
MQTRAANPVSSLDAHRHRSKDTHDYALGYSEREFRRLEMQSRIVGDLTEDVMRRAGIRKGMRVLDLGCGVGDVSLLAAWLVGPSGYVLGVDRSAEALATAERRVREAGQSGWVRFAAAELDEFVPDEPFDAIVGRLVLMYLPQPAQTLRRLAAYLRPGGILAFHEMSMPAMRSCPAGDLFSRCRRWLIDAIRCSGFETEMGDKLYATLTAAGLPAPEMIAAGRVEGGPASPVYDYVAETLKSLVPAIERAGIATAGEIDVDSLAERLRRETTANGACIVLPPYVGAWTRLRG